MKLHPVTQTHDGFFNARSGIKVSIHNPTPEMITIEDIAGALSKICRYGGHTPLFYSVAQHSLLVEWLVRDKSFSKIALLHDAAEAYCGDVIKPLKRIIGESYDTVEERFMRVICQKFDVDYNQLSEIKHFDTQALVFEHDYFWNKNRDLEGIYRHEMGYADMPSVYWIPEVAERFFLYRYREVFEAAPIRTITNWPKEMDTVQLDTREPKTGHYCCIRAYTNSNGYFYQESVTLLVLRHIPNYDCMRVLLSGEYPDKEFDMPIQELLDNWIPNEFIH